MTANTATKHNNVQLKADFFPITVLKINSADMQNIKDELSKIQTTAPNYFNNTPVVIDAATLPEQQTLDMATLREMLLQFNMQPVGIRGLDKQLEEKANHHGFTILNSKSSAPSKSSTKKTSKKNIANTTKVINKPIRAGTQVYAKDSDLIVMSAVNAGAECIADGNIHIYGPLRGRAIAGAIGDSNCHIFCQELDAELISIAGRYLVKENIKAVKTKHTMLHIFVQDDQLIIEGI